jgi:hypothetical protein
MSSTNNYSKAKKILKIAAVTVAISMFLSNTHLIFGLISTVLPLGSSGVVSSANINAYKEVGCVNELSSVSWGSISPGGSKQVTVYLKNIGSVALVLSLSTSGWSPSGAGGYFSLTWNYGGQTLQPNQVLSVKFTLSVSGSIKDITDFSFDIYITGTEPS